MHQLSKPFLPFRDTWAGIILITQRPCLLHKKKSKLTVQLSVDCKTCSMNGFTYRKGTRGCTAFLECSACRRKSRDQGSWLLFDFCRSRKECQWKKTKSSETMQVHAEELTSQIPALCFLEAHQDLWSTMSVTRNRWS